MVSISTRGNDYSGSTREGLRILNEGKFILRIELNTSAGFEVT